MGLETRGGARIPILVPLSGSGGGMLKYPSVFVPLVLSVDIERPSRSVLRSVIVDSGRSSAERASAVIGVESKLKGGSCKDVPFL